MILGILTAFIFPSPTIRENELLKELINREVKESLFVEWERGWSNWERNTKRRSLVKSFTSTMYSHSNTEAQKIWFSSYGIYTLPLRSSIFLWLSILNSILIKCFLIARLLISDNGDCLCSWYGIMEEQCAHIYFALSPIHMASLV